ncbi:MAG: hypothetical protein JSV09_12390 [Thermoplasmata archaeon]|nr:MAG: hypothetical protein JSV09_12390 [Thermoplasmata archaeon]
MAEGIGKIGLMHMSKSRGEKLNEEISDLEDAILFAESKGFKDIEWAKSLLERVRKFLDQGTWSMAERELSKAGSIKGSDWYIGFIEGRGEEKGRFEDDGLCSKYGHEMVMIKLSNVRWYYQCRLCKKRGKSRSIK